MPHTRIRPRRTVAWPLAVVRGLAALTALAALLAGVPWLLLKIGTLPQSVPSGQTLQDALSAPDDGTGLMMMLTGAAWIAWLWLTIPVLLEIGAVTVRRTTPRLPGMATGQRLAAYLLGSVLLASPAAAASAATPAVAATAPHAPHTSAATPLVDTGRPDAPAAATSTLDGHGSAAVRGQDGELTLQEHAVGQGGTTWWDLAEQYLGDGLRYPELQHLNPALPTDRILPEGTTVLVPAASPATTTADTAEAAGSQHASGGQTAEPEGLHTQLAASATSVEQTQDEVREYTVRPGDSLTRIAQEQLGDANQWHQVFEENKGEQQPYGHHFTDPDLIFPGQDLTLRANAAGQDRTGTDRPQDQHAGPKQHHDDGTSDRDKASSTPDDATGSGASGGAATLAPAPSATTPSASPSTSATPHSPATAPSTQHPSAPTTAAPAPASDQGNDQGRQTGVFGLMATGVLAAGFLSFLGYRRITQLRRRRRGYHIPLPQGDAARVEHALHVTEAMLDTAVLEPVLRTMAVHLSDNGRELPQVAAIVLGERDIVLHLAEPAAPVPPFTATPDQLQYWSCPTNTSEILPAHDSSDIDEPYPALVSLGWDTDGRLVLIDLEHVGHLHLSGPSADAVLRTLALELATSEFTHHLDLTLVGDTLAPDLADEVGERVTQRTLAEALAVLRAHHDDQQRALSLLGAPTLRHARTGIDTAAAWTPSLVITYAPEDTDTDQADRIEDLLQVVATEPRTATAVLTTGSLPPTAPTWTLHADPEAGPVRLPLGGVDIDCTLQALSDEHYAYALETLALSRAADVPAPQPSLLTASAPEPELVNAAGEDTPPVALPVTSTASAAGPGRVPNLLAQFAALDDEDDSSDDDRASGETDRDGQDQGDDELSAAHASTPLSAGVGHDADPGVVPLDKPERSPAASPGPVPAQQAPGRTVSIRLPVEGLPEPVLSEADSANTAAETDEPESPHPVVRVLGPVDVAGTRGALTEKKRQRTYIELAAWLVLHPGHHPNALDHRALDEALWPDKDEVSLKYRNAVVSRTRTWLGRDSEDQPYIPLLKTANSRYNISPTVGCDWHDFQRLTQTGKDPRTAQADADLALRQALELVRGRPFSSTDRRRYKWAEHLALVMTMEIVDAAEILSERRLAVHDPRGALWATTKGLEVAPAVESLHRIAFQAYAAIGDYEALERAATWLEEFTENNDLELDDETLAVLDQLRARV
jgi:nucleoid-associated protein YgaU